MASPFSLFRKHEKVLMVVLVIMAMFAFTLTDLFTQSETNVPLLGFLIGGAGMALLGISSGKSFLYGVVGGVVGLLAGFAGPVLFPPSPAVTTTVADLSDEELQDLIQRRNVANQFIQLYWFRAQEKAREAQKKVWLKDNPDKTDADFETENPPRTQRSPIIFAFGRPIDEDVVLGMLLRSEADKMGMQVSDESVNELVDNLCERAGLTAGLEPTDALKRSKLTFEEFTEIRGNLQYRGGRVAEAQLFEILQSEIRSFLAYRLLLPRVPPTPDRFWEYYRRLHVRQELELVSVPTDDFLDRVTEQPTDADLEELFAKWKDRVPNQQASGDPGFFQMGRVQLGLMEVDYLAVETALGEPTEEELLAYYEANKETQFKIRDIPEPSGAVDGASGGPSLTTPEVPSLPAPAQPKTEDESSDSPAADKPASDDAGTDKTGGGETEPSPSDAPAKSDAGSAEADASTKAADQPEASGTQPEDNCVPQEEPQEASTPAAGGDSPAETPAAGQPAADQPAAATKPQENASDGDPAAQPSLTVPAPQAADGTASEQPADTPAADSAPADTTESEPKSDGYQPFEEVRDVIRDRLLAEKTRTEIDSRIERISEAMRSLSAQMSLAPAEEGAEAPERLTAQQAAEELTKLAATDPVIVYRETGLLTQAEMLEEEEAIAQATDPGDSSFEKSTVIEMLFPESNQTYVPQVGADVSGNQFVYWVVQQVEPHVPVELAEVREEVELAWKRLRARELAEARAKDLEGQVAAAIKQGGAFADGLPQEKPNGEQVETPAEDGEKTDEEKLLESGVANARTGSLRDSVQDSLPFSWLRTPSTPSTGFSPQRVELSSIMTQGAGQVEGAGDEFMRYVFNELDEGQVGVVSSFDKQYYYVVRPKNRSVVLSGMMQRNERVLPENQESLDELRKSFMDDLRMVDSQFFGFMSPIPQLVGRDQQMVNYNWSRELEKAYQVEWRNRGGI